MTWEEEVVYLVRKWSVVNNTGRTIISQKLSQSIARFD